jgi:hypothetical protein
MAKKIKGFAGTEPQGPEAAGSQTLAVSPGQRKDSGPTQPVKEFDGVLRRDDGRVFAEAGSIRIFVDAESVMRAPAERRAPSAAARAIPEDLKRAIDVANRHRDELMRPGVVAVRGGYLFQDGEIQDRVAVVVSVAPEARTIASALPREIEGVPVDVAPASPSELLAQAGRAAGTESAVAAIAPPLFIDQLQGGGESLELFRQITYQPPQGVALEEVTGPMSITCHVSPDAGWETLRPFLQDTERSLHLGMYDFTAPHILETLRSVLRDSEADFQMTLDPGESLPSRNNSDSDPDSPKANDRTEASIIRSLRRVAGERFRVAFAATGDGRTFASAYHIKVAVRDRRAFWLSSGNWQSSNQPAIDFLDSTADRRLLKKHNREWHVVVEHAGLARTFEAFLDHDFRTAESEEAAAIPTLKPEILVPVEEILEAEAEVAPLQVFAPRRFTFTSQRPLRVQPLLTPDNYAEHVLRLLKTAREKVYFQNQTLKPNANASPEFAEMMDVLARFSRRDDMDVRIIFRDIGDTRKVKESLKAAGFNMKRVRTQRTCHTKGIIIDGATVVIGSHNWSDEGVMQNRDASLIIHNRQIASYFEDVFLHDWERMTARPRQQEFAAMLATTEAAGDEFVAIPWADWHGEG